MDDKIQKAFDIADYMATLAAQKQVLKEEFNQNLLHFQNGGTFTITRELILFVNLLKGVDSSAVLVDDNNIPVEIADLGVFLETILSKYQFAVNGYYTKYLKIKHARTVESILK